MCPPSKIKTCCRVTVIVMVKIQIWSHLEALLLTFSILLSACDIYQKWYPFTSSPYQIKVF